MDQVFRALADPTRRRLLDRLHEDDGLSLGELCERIGMSRQAVTQHLTLLEAANLISTLRRGRTKLHYLNPVPIHEIQRRWVNKFQEPHLRTLGRLKDRLETAMADKPSYRYVTYITSTPEKVWQALTDPAITAEYWGHRNENAGNWETGSTWQHTRSDDSGLVDGGGTILESDPPHKLVWSWGELGETDPDKFSRATFEIEPRGKIVRLTVTHDELTSEQELDDISGGWPAVLANLKSLLETGRPMPQDPWVETAEAAH